MDNFKCTAYMVQKSRKSANKDTPRRGRPSIAPSLSEKVIQFYHQDDISRPFPGMRDTISIKLQNGKRETRQKRLLLNTIQELYEKF